VIALFSMIVLPRAMSLGPSPDEGFMEKSYLYPQSQQHGGIPGLYEQDPVQQSLASRLCVP
jgi:hypothetical protein